MIRVSGIKVPLDYDLSNLEELCAKKLKIFRNNLISVRLAKKSVDARKKDDVHFIVSLDIEVTSEDWLLKSIKNAVKIEKTEYKITRVISTERPVIVGFGPAGMFAALVLAMAGAKPIVLERGADVDSRLKAVEEFQNGGKLDTESNVQFGEGGAGTFSDGKLTTGTKDKRIGWIFEQLIAFGAPEEIGYEAKPHIGTDNLRNIVKTLRERVIDLGGEVRFGAKFSGFEAENNQISVVKYNCCGEEHTIISKNVILATGHSARDIFELLYEKNITLSQKNFAVGVRIEHRRFDIDRAMYGKFAGHKALKAADYKLALHLANGRSLYTFCMCPGGHVVAASSEEGHLAVNGMSYFNRDAENSNSSLLVNINTEDYGSDHPLAGMYFQRELEKKAFVAGGSDYSAPIITVGDFLNRKVSNKIGKVKPSYRPNTKIAELETYLPKFVCDSLRMGIPEMGKRIKGFANSDSVLTGIESRSSSPVRITRNERLQSVSLEGLFPCGEGAGYAGGIVSAAVDGVKCAEAVIERLIDITRSGK